MSHYLSYWKPSTVRAILASRQELLEHAASNQYDRLKAGDTVWIVTVWPGGHLILLGRLVIDEVADFSTAARRMGTKDLWKASHHILATLGRAEPIREVDLGEVAAALRFESDRDRLHVKEWKVDGKQLQTMRRLTLESVSVLAAAWEATTLLGVAASALSDSRRHGAGFGTADSNREAERRAIDYVQNGLRNDGWKVDSVESQRIGFDLLCVKGKTQRHVEVKGVRGSVPAFFITDGELQRARADDRFWLYVVTDAMSESPRLHVMRGHDMIRTHEFIALVHRAVPVTHRAARAE